MARIIAGWTLAAILTALGGGPAVAQDKETEAFPHREIRGPKGLPDRRPIFAHMTQVVFTRDSAKMAAGAGANIFIWNVADGKELVRMQLPDQQAYHRIAFSDDGKTLVWCGREDPMIRILDTVTGRQLREFLQPNVKKEEAQPGEKREEFSSRFVTFSPDAQRMAFHGLNYYDEIDIIDVATEKLVLRIKDLKDFYGVIFSPDGSMLAVTFHKPGINLYDAKTGKLLRELRKPHREGEDMGFTVAAFSPDGNFLAVGGQPRATLDVWSVKTGKRVSSRQCKIHFSRVAFTTDSQSLVCVETDGLPYLYHLLAEKETYRFNPPARLCHFVKITPDGKRAALIGEATNSDPNVRHESIFLYELPAKVLNPPAAQVDDATLEKLWEELSTDNDLRLQRVLGAFRTAPQPTVALFRKNLRHVSPEQRAKVEKWIADLDDPEFTKRDQAMKDLRQVAHQFGPLLKARLEKADPGEIRNRLTFLLKQVEIEPLPASLVTELRAVTVLEQLATPEARELLTKVAEGAPQARLTVEAQAALERVTKGKKADK